MQYSATIDRASPPPGVWLGARCPADVAAIRKSANSLMPVIRSELVERVEAPSRRVIFYGFGRPNRQTAWAHCAEEVTFLQLRCEEARSSLIGS